VLVTHDMATVQGFCDRAMLLHDGKLQYIGDPEEAVLRYYRLNFGGGAAGDSSHGGEDAEVRLVDVWLEDDSGKRVENVQQGEPIRLNLVLEAHRDLPEPSLIMRFLNVDDAPVFGLGKSFEAPVPADQRVRFSAKIDNRLVPGRYSVDCSITRSDTPGDLALRSLRVLDFLIKGTEPTPGMVSVAADLEAVVEP
jgi:Wzt C-terminal domain